MISWLFSMIARLIFDELVDSAQRIRNRPFSPTEREDVARDFNLFIDALTNLLSHISLDEILQLFPADKRRYVRVLLDVLHSLRNVFGDGQ